MNKALLPAAHTAHDPRKEYVMTNVMLRVTLKNGILHVDESGHANEIGNGRTIITWRLRRSCLNRGSFNAICDPIYPGFSWITPSLADVFEHAKLECPGNKIQVTDNHCEKDLPREYEYKLCATINGKPYSTEAKLPDCKRNPKSRTSNPRIKNV